MLLKHTKTKLLITFLFLTIGYFRIQPSGNLGFVEDRVPTVATCFNEGDWRKTYGDMYLDVLERRDWKEMIGDALTVAANAPSRDVKAL